jgi:hypothetical protein
MPCGRLFAAGVGVSVMVGSGRASVDASIDRTTAVSAKPTDMAGLMRYLSGCCQRRVSSPPPRTAALPRAHEPVRSAGALFATVRHSTPLAWRRRLYTDLALVRLKVARAGRGAGPPPAPRAQRYPRKSKTCALSRRREPVRRGEERRGMAPLAEVLDHHAQVCFGGRMRCRRRDRP